jgi:hypothetical protein
VSRRPADVPNGLIVIDGLQLPHLSEWDPDLLGEGSLDPLGLSGIVDRLAEGIAPGVRARMSRVRFLTAIAVCSSVTQNIQDAPAADNTSTPYLAFEWLFVQALAYFPKLPKPATFNVPGTEKARSVVYKNGNLDGPSYLKIPKVFGFHGVYKPLAGSIGLVDRNLLLSERGDQLVRVWERQRDLVGFIDRIPKTRGGILARKIEDLVARALGCGHVSVKSGETPSVWWPLADGLRLDGMKAPERKLLSRWMRDDSQPLRTELFNKVDELRASDASEADILREIRSSSSSGLSEYLDAIESFETACVLLTLCFDILRRLSTEIGLTPVTPTHVNELATFTKSARNLSQAMSEANDRLEPLGLGASFAEAGLDRFVQPFKPRDLVGELLDYHEKNQANKPPGKRSWFDSVPGGFIIRSQYRLENDPEPNGEYLHPYRINALKRFSRELAGEAL